MDGRLDPLHVHRDPLATARDAREAARRGLAHRRRTGGDREDQRFDGLPRRQTLQDQRHTPSAARVGRLVGEHLAQGRYDLGTEGGQRRGRLQDGTAILELLDERRQELQVPQLPGCSDGAAADPGVAVPQEGDQRPVEPAHSDIAQSFRRGRPVVRVGRAEQCVERTSGGEHAVHARVPDQRDGAGRPDEREVCGIQKREHRRHGLLPLDGAHGSQRRGSDLRDGIREQLPHRAVRRFDARLAELLHGAGPDARIRMREQVPQLGGEVDAGDVLQQGDGVQGGGRVSLECNPERAKPAAIPFPVTTEKNTPLPAESS